MSLGGFFAGDLFAFLLPSTVFGDEKMSATVVVYRVR